MVIQVRVSGDPRVLDSMGAGAGVNLHPWV
jgi:hypothetical protein